MTSDPSPTPTPAKSDSPALPVTDAWKRWIVTLLGSGMLPFAPGTFGSLLATFILILLHHHVIPRQDDLTWNLTLVITLVLYSALCVILGPWTHRYYAKKDPGPCVLDEAAGISLTALFVPMKAPWTFVAVFVTFRVFDILKPPPARQLEKLPAGWGILLDDLAAAVYANVTCQILLRFVL
jgi:phosphatidylglycerophosphatase A